MQSGQMATADGLITIDVDKAIVKCGDRTATVSGVENASPMMPYYGTYLSQRHGTFQRRQEKDKAELTWAWESKLQAKYDKMIETISAYIGE